jgi:hypothetical protein
LGATVFQGAPSAPNHCAGHSESKSETRRRRPLGSEDGFAEPELELEASKFANLANFQSGETLKVSGALRQQGFARDSVIPNPSTKVPKEICQLNADAIKSSGLLVWVVLMVVVVVVEAEGFETSDEAWDCERRVLALMSREPDPPQSVPLV